MLKEEICCLNGAKIFIKIIIRCNEYLLKYTSEMCLGVHVRQQSLFHVIFLPDYILALSFVKRARIMKFS